MANQTKKGEALPAIEDVLDKLRERRQRLDAADSQISNLIKEIETELQTHFSVRVSIDITDHSDGGTGGVETSLAFGKHDGKWQLMVEVDFPDGAGSTTPLLSCPRETRVRVIADGHIEALIRGAVGQLDKQISVREKAIDKGTQLVRALTGIPF